MASTIPHIAIAMKNSAPPTPLRASSLFLILGGIASLFLAAGVIGFFAPEVLPILGEGRIPHVLVGIGVVLELASVAVMLRSMRQRGKQRLHEVMHHADAASRKSAIRR